MRRLAPADAAARLVGVERFDPRGVCTAADIAGMCQAGQCFALEGAADAVYVVRVVNGLVWVDAAQGSGSVDIVAALDHVVSAQAPGMPVGLQTKRRGLVAKLQRRGFRVTGWIMKRDARVST